jgi:hypothetical protein
MPHKGVCVGGPMAGLTINTRSDVGFVAVDKPASAAWVYKIDPDNGRYVLDVSPDPSSLDEDGTRALDLDRVLTAGLEKGLDVIALPDSEPDPDEVPAEVDLFGDVPDEPVIEPGDAKEGED